MKIVIIIQQIFDPFAGGVQRVTASLSKLLKGKHEIFIISYNENEIIRNVNGIPIIPAVDAKDLKIKILQLSPDIIINQTGYSLNFTKLLLKIKNNNSMIINNLHINPLNFYVNHKDLIQELFNRKKIGFLNTIISRKIILGYHIIKQNLELHFIVKNTDAFVMLSEKFKPELFFLVPSLKKYESKIFGIGNPFKRPVIDLNSVSKENVILFVGRLNVPQKRVDLLLQIWKKLHEEVPDWQFWICGEGEEKNNMEKFCVENNMDRVKFFGKVNPNEYYKKAKIFHMTSAFEGFGNVLIEAQSYGCVPMLFDSYAAASDIVCQNINGILIQPFNINDYVKQTIKLMHDSENRNKMAYNGYENVLRFSYEESCKKWENVFELISENKKIF
ncbi:glycosyltransferase [Flavobacterium sp.]|uniref:glycosyltransferase n=1 Tax=Flavobacterium sp. TaxID=239 RepID=UPI0040471188